MHIKMNRQQFHLLLKRYVENQSTPEELKFIHHWYELLGNEPLQDLSLEDALEVENRIWQKIQENVTPSIKSPIRKLRMKWLAVAASLLVIVSISIAYLLQNKPDKNNIYASVSGDDYKELSNGTNNDMSINLEDSSVVLLKKGSRLKYPIHFQKNKREVYLKGEAFFEVSKNAKRPFYVYSNSIVTHVLGTSFTVKPSADGTHTEVDVRTGRVEVYENQQAKSKNNTNKGVVLLPNQKVIYSEKGSVFETTLVDNPQQLRDIKADSTNTVFIADDKPLNEIIDELKTLYGIEIVLENDNINNCHFTGNIEKQNLYGKLDFICQSINATYEIKGTRILIRGKGCN
jgi:transmembrane sensor